MRYSLTFEGVTLTAVADTTNFTDSGYAYILQGGSSTMRLNVNEVYAGGESASAAVTKLKLARDSTVGATVSAGSARLAAMSGSSVAPGTVPVYGNSSTTKPQRSSTLHLLGLTFNAYGGAIRWQARPGEEITSVGNTASLGETSLSAFTGGSGIISGHCIFEEE